MTTPINLNKVRKTRQRDADRKQADVNAVIFGQSKAERVLAAARTEQAAHILDRHRIDEEE